MKPRKYQLEAVEWFKTTPDIAYLCDGMGAGKTLTSILIMQDQGVSSALIITPLSNIDSYKSLLEKHNFTVCTDPEKYTRGILLINPQKLLKITELPNICLAMLIIDEAHMFRHLQLDKKKLRSSYVNRLFHPTLGFAKYFTRRLYMSGTPIDATFIELYPIFCNTHPQLIDRLTFEHFQLKHYDYHTFEIKISDKFSHKLRKFTTGKPSVYEWFNNVKHKFLMRHVKFSIVQNKKLIDITKDIPEADMKEFNEVKFGYQDLINDPKLLNDFTKLKTQIQKRKKQIEEKLGHEVPSLAVVSGYTKVVPAYNLIKTLEGNTLVIAKHHAAMDRLQSLLGEDCKVYSGATSKKQRQEIMEWFKHGNDRVLIGQISAVGTGTDGLQVNCNNIVLLEYDWNVSNNKQALARIQRFGVKDNCMQAYFLSFPQGLDTRIFANIKKKTKETEKFYHLAKEIII